MSLLLAMYFTPEQLSRMTHSPIAHNGEPLNIKQCDAIAAPCSSPATASLLADFAGRGGKKWLIGPLPAHIASSNEIVGDDWRLFDSVAAQPQVIATVQWQWIANWDADTLPEWLMVPAPVLAVARGIINIYKLDPYLARHYLRQLKPLLDALTPHDIDSLLWAKMDPLSAQLTPRQHQFCQFEKKIVRQYDAH